MTGLLIRTAVAALTVAAALSLAACGGGAGPTPSPTPTATPTPTASPTPTPTPTPTATPDAPTSDAANIPTDCSALGTPDSYAQTVGDLTLQGDGVGFVRPAPEGATLALGCDWIVGDSTGLLLLISTATPDAVTAAVATLPGQGYSCQVSDDFGAQFCTMPSPNGQPDSEFIVVAGDDVWIFYQSSNRNARAFLSDIAQQIYG